MERTWILRLRWIVTFLFATALVGIGVVGMLWSIDLLPSQSLTLYSGQLSWQWLSTDYGARSSFIAICLGVFSIGVLLWILCLMRARPRNKHFVIHKSKGFQNYGGAQVLLSNRGLHALTQYVLDQVDGVMQSEPTIILKAQGWTITCRVYVWHGAAMPDLVQRATTQLKHALEHHTGIPVDRVNITAEYQSWQHGGQVL